MKENVICNNCHSTKEISLYENEGLRYVLCVSCGLGYINPRPTRSDYQAHYRDSYQHDRHAVTTYEEAIHRLERKGSYEKKKKHLRYIEKYIRADSRILEVGSGWGTLLAVIRDTIGALVSGVELSSLGVEVSRKLYGLSIHQIPIEEFVDNSPRASYDLIIANHVVEHFLDPKDLLSALRTLLAPGAHAYIAVPNLAKPDEPPNAFFRMQHPYYFSPKTLREMLLNTGFDVVSLDASGNDIRCIVKLGVETGLLPRISLVHSFILYIRIKLFIAVHFLVRLARKIFRKQ